MNQQPTTPLRDRLYAESENYGLHEDVRNLLRDPAALSPPALEGMDLLRPTPMRATSYGTQEPEYRMDAYWYGFSPTGLDIIDTILSAVACAGKGYHSTEQWNEDSDPRHDRLRGTTPVAHIQNAANDAAAAIRAASPAAPAQPEGGEAVAKLLARAAEVVCHDIDCLAIGGNGDDDCRCDAVPFLRDLQAALTRPVAAQCCSAREQSLWPDNPPPGPSGLLSCALPAGHDGPHRGRQGDDFVPLREPIAQPPEAATQEGAK